MPYPHKILHNVLRWWFDLCSIIAGNGAGVEGAPHGLGTHPSQVFTHTHPYIYIYMQCRENSRDSNLFSHKMKCSENIFKWNKFINKVCTGMLYLLYILRNVVLQKLSVLTLNSIWWLRRRPAVKHCLLLQLL